METEQRWTVNGVLHRDDDLPALIDMCGTKYWYQHGKLHRNGDQPAILSLPQNHWEGEEGEAWLRSWYQYGNLHRDGDQPAYIEGNGTQKWYQHGKLHRDGDQPAIIGYEKWGAYSFTHYYSWYQHNKLHRDGDQPAEIHADGTQVWYCHGKLHRENNRPAVVSLWFPPEWWEHNEYIPSDIIHARNARNKKACLTYLSMAHYLPADVMRFLISTFT